MPQTLARRRRSRLVRCERYHATAMLRLLRGGLSRSDPRPLAVRGCGAEMTPQYILEKSLCRPAACGTCVPENDIGAYPIAQIRDVRNARMEIENLGFAKEYAEPGYDDPKRGILFANWNYFPSGIYSILERYGYEIEWPDEWTTCDNCSRAVRTQPTSYSWQPSQVWVESEYETLCVDCLAEDPEPYLRSLENDPRRALNIEGIDPADYGYELIGDDYENGFHPGQNDDPKQITREARANGITEPLLFQIDSVGQFDVSFRLWKRIA